MVAAAAENGYTSEARGITADARSWGTARTKAREYADQHDPAKIAERHGGPEHAANLWGKALRRL